MTLSEDDADPVVEVLVGAPEPLAVGVAVGSAVTLGKDSKLSVVLWVKVLASQLAL